MLVFCQILSVDGIYFYMAEILRQYSSRLRYRPQRISNAVEFVCGDSGQYVWLDAL